MESTIFIKNSPPTFILFLFFFLRKIKLITSVKFPNSPIKSNKVARLNSLIWSKPNFIHRISIDSYWNPIIRTKVKFPWKHSSKNKDLNRIEKKQKSATRNSLTLSSFSELKFRSQVKIFSEIATSMENQKL